MSDKIKIENTAECLESLGKALDSLALRYNAEYQAEKPSLAALAKMDEEFRELESDYANVKTNLVFESCFKADRPMRAAMLKHEYPVKRHRMETEGEDKSALKICRVNDKSIPLDLLAFDTYCEAHGKRASVNSQWSHMITKLNMLLTADVAKSLGIDPATVNNSFAMSEIARKIDLGKTPTSNTNLLKTVQSIVDAMIYEENPETKSNSYKASSHDVAYLREIFSRKGKKELAIACAKPSFMRGIMADICYRIVGDKMYQVEFKIKKESANAASDKSVDAGNAKPDSKVDAKPDSKVDAKPDSKVATGKAKSRTANKATVAA